LHQSTQTFIDRISESFKKAVYIFSQQGLKVGMSHLT